MLNYSLMVPGALGILSIKKSTCMIGCDWVNDACHIKHFERSGS